MSDPHNTTLFCPGGNATRSSPRFSDRFRGIRAQESYRVQETVQVGRQPTLISNLAFSNYKNTPALPAQALDVLLVPSPIPFEFWEPVICMGLRLMREPAVSMRVPIAPIDLNDFSKTREDEVRRPRESADVQPVPVAHAVNQPTHGHLGRRILAADAPHVLTSTLWWESVRNTQLRFLWLCD